MKRFSFLLLFPLLAFITAPLPDGKEILDKVDKNLTSKTRIMISSMVIHGVRGERSIRSKTWAEGEANAFTEYLAPAREEGTKMLKLGDKLWIYTPASDRTIQISGHMLRQSVMGSDLSYEDMMEDGSLRDKYEAKVTSEENYEGRVCYVLTLTATVTDVAFLKQKIWVDKDRFVPLKQEMYSKSDKLMKRITLSDVKKVDGRWFPHRMVFKDMLKSGDGTEFIIEEIQFDVEIPPYLLTKAALKK